MYLKSSLKWQVLQVASLDISELGIVAEKAFCKVSASTVTVGTVLTNASHNLVHVRRRSQAWVHETVRI